MVGTTISHYRILEKIGEGGMGEVYRGEDLRLKRPVAIKVVSRRWGEEPAAEKRLIREAQAAAVLSHPNVATVFEVGEHEGQWFLVTEFVEGEDLRQKISQQPLSLVESLDIVIQAAEGLQVAHEMGIFHRDVKSSNIMVDRKGRVRVLDFGLAHLSGRTRITGTGMSLGTPAYMSPEQASGGVADFRSDVWGLGVVFYELLSGKLPFAGDTPAALIHSIIYSDATPLTALRSGLPLEVDRVAAKMLSKDPAERYQHMDDLLVDLRGLHRSMVSTPGVQTSDGYLPPRQRKKPRWPVFGVGMAVLIVAICAGIFLLMRPAEEKQPMRFISRLPEGQSFSGLTSQGSAITISRDGSEIVYTARIGNVLELWHRGIGEVTAERVPGTEWGRAPFISPDLKWVGFTTGKDVLRVSLSGGSAEAVGTSTAGALFSTDNAFFGGSWAADGESMYLGECTRGLSRFDLNTGNPTVLTDIFGESLYRQHQFPQPLPGERQVLYTRWLSEKVSEIAVFDLDSGTSKTLVTKATNGRYASSGHVVYAWEGNLYAAPFDLKELSLTGPAQLVVEGVLTNTTRGAAHFDISENGTLVYIPGGVLRTSCRLAWVDREGNVEVIEGLDRQNPESLRLSPSGAEVMLSIPSEHSGQMAVCVFEFERGILRQLTEDVGGSYHPLWIDAGQRIVYTGFESQGEAIALFSKATDLAAPRKRLIKLDSGFYQAYSVTSDGDLVLQYWADMSIRDASIAILSLDTGAAPRWFLNTPAVEFQPTVSPNGRWIAYSTNESGKFQVMVRSFPDASEVHQVSVDGALEPIWAPDGKRLYFRALDGETIYSADLEVGDKLKVSGPEVVLTGSFRGGGLKGYAYAVHPDGNRFLVWLEPERPPLKDEYNVILNWTEELKKIR